MVFKCPIPAPALSPPAQGRIYFNSTSNTFKASQNGGAYSDLVTSASVATGYVAKAGDTMTGPLVNNSSSASTALAVTQAGAGYAATFMGANVGIGTTTPAASLEVNTTSPSAVLLRLNNNGANAYDFVRSASTGDLSIQGTQIGANNIVLAPTSGNVGVATAAPIEKLEVTGGIRGGQAPATLTALSAAALIGDVTLTVTSTAGYPSQGTLLVDTEAMIYTGVTATTFTGLTRGTLGSTAAGHALSATVNNYLETLQATSTTPKMVVTGSGNVGIGVTAPQAALDVAATGITSAIIIPRDTTANRPVTLVNGMIRYNTTTALFEFYQNGIWVNYTTVSDGRLKTNVIPVGQGLNIVNQLNPVFFDWDQNNPRAQGFGTKHQVGFIAQDVEKVLPEVVNKGEDSYRSVEYGKIVAVVVAAVKELYNKVLDIEKNIEALKFKDAAKDREIASVKAENAELKAKAQKAEQENALIKARLEKIEKILKVK